MRAETWSNPSNSEILMSCALVVMAWSSGLTEIIRLIMHDRVHGCFYFGLCQHGFMKADLRISIKDYSRPPSLCCGATSNKISIRHKLPQILRQPPAQQRAAHGGGQQRHDDKHREQR